ncbi:hypothetical protein RB653_001018 [Dictyostelium firmibasis]|uniref:Uncharacterized protein n=1 Tax=Dictyostelium firmibasis TaxID=79012 RepID=A0AAN7U4B0_9MYCE
MLCLGALSNSKTINVDSNRYSRIVLDKDKQRVYFSLLDKKPVVASIPMNNINSNGNTNLRIEATLPNGYSNLIWRNPATGDFLVGDNSLKPDGHRSARVLYPTGTLGKIVNTNHLNTAYQNYFGVANAGSFTYDNSNGQIYMCSVYERGVFSLSSILMTPINGGLSATGTCEQVKKINNAFYFLEFAINGTQSSIFSNATAPLYSHFSSSPIVVSDTTIKDFDVSSTHIYYSNSFTNKIYEVPLYGGNAISSRRKILDFMPDSFGYHNGYIYFSNGFSISRISIAPNSQPEVLYFEAL